LSDTTNDGLLNHIVENSWYITTVQGINEGALIICLISPQFKVLMKVH